MANIKTYRDLRLWQSAMDAAMDIWTLSKKFPPEEHGALTDPLRLASRTIPVRVAEAWRKRHHPSKFVEKLHDAESRAAETQTLIEFASRCGFFSVEEASELDARYEDILTQLTNMISQPDKWISSKETVLPMPSPAASLAPDRTSASALKKQ